MRIAVASGKGGTGKTTVAVSLALSLGDVQFVDADAEAPNAHLFLHPVIEKTIPVPMIIPEVDLGKCTFCGKCATFCQYNALAVLDQEVLLFPELCHGCGGCAYACPEGAITSGERQIGEVEVGSANGLRFIQGRLHPREPSAVRIVRRELDELAPDRIAIVDAAPGTACAVQDTIGDSDFTLLVTEPSPFGLHDLRMASAVAKELDVPSAVVINRSGPRDPLIEEECRTQGLPVIMKIPFDRRIAEAYSRGEPLIECLPEYRAKFVDLYKKIEGMVTR